MKSLRRSVLSLASLVALAACGSDSTSTAPEADYTTPGSIVIANFSDNQSAPAGVAFAHPLEVIVFTPGNLKCYGCNVTWTLSPGSFQGGPIQTKTVVTGFSGLNITSLSPRGVYHVTAQLDNGQSVTFTLTAM
jgi:hypothetical protein